MAQSVDRTGPPRLTTWRDWLAVTLPATLCATLAGVTAAQAQATGSSATNCPPGAIVVASGQSIQARVDAAGPSAQFCLERGTYRLQSVVPKNGQSFYGQGGAVLNGSSVLTSFRAEGRLWVATAADPVGIEHGDCAAPGSTCARPAGAFVDGLPLVRAGTEARLQPGQFSFDPTRNRLALAADPAGHLIEWATTQQAFSGPATDVVLDGLVIEKYANPAQSGAVWPGGTGWRLSALEARYNNGVGLVGGSSGVIENSNVHHNGQLGIGAGGVSGLTIRGNEVWGNNIKGFDDQWEAGGLKVAQSSNVVFSNNNVHDNLGPGLWCDESCTNVLIEANVVSGNSSAGIFYEISTNAVIRNNTLIQNDTAGQSWLWGAAIQIAASSNVVVSGNTITVRPGGKSIMLIDQNRQQATGGYYQNRNDQVFGNDTTFLGDGIAGGASDAEPGAVNYGIIQNGGNSFDFNTYHYNAGSTVSFIWGGDPIDLETFRNLGQERNGTVVLGR